MLFKTTLIIYPKNDKQNIVKAKIHNYFKIIILKWPCILQKNDYLILFHLNRPFYTWYVKLGK